MPASRNNIKSWAVAVANASPLDRKTEVRTEYPEYLEQWAPRDATNDWKESIGTSHEWTWQRAISKCDSYLRSKEYAKLLDPTAILDYIPMAAIMNFALCYLVLVSAT